MNNRKLCAMCRRMVDEDELVRGRFTFICPECKEKEIRHLQERHTKFDVIP